MTRYKPGLDDDRLVTDALAALAHDTEALEAPPAVEARLRAAFRQSEAAPRVAPAPSGSGAWKWIAAVGAAAGLAWMAYAAARTGSASPRPRSAEHPQPIVPAVARPQGAPPPVDPARTIAAAPPTVRVAADERRPATRRRPRAEPVVERFEPLYPGDPLADLDAVHLVRVSVPRSSLGSLGWPTRPGGREDRVELDAMVGSDGMTRAVRFISQ